MKWKKVVSVFLVGALTLSMGACGAGADKQGAAQESDKQSEGDGKLVIWTLADDLVDFGERYEKETGVDVETVVIEPANYQTKVQTALVAGETEPDIIVGEPKMLDDFYDAGFFEDLDQFGAKDYEGDIVDYVWEVGQSDDGVQRAISYQITPAGIYYRRDIAKEVFGSDDPEEIGKLFADYPTILNTAEKLKEAGYRIFSSDAEMNVFSGDSAWVKDGTLNLSDARKEYMDLCVDLYQNDLTAYASTWSTPWYQAMAGEVPILTADIQNAEDDSVNVWDEAEFEKSTKDMEKTQVFAFGLPAWGVLTMKDHVGDTKGSWGVCAGPSSGFDGGTYIGISSQSERKQTAWDFVKFCTLNEETADWWIDFSEGDTVSLKSALEKHKDDTNALYGGEKLYQFWLNQAKEIDTSKVTRYDTAIGDAWGNAISSVKTGKMSKEDAINDFYDKIESTYPDIKVER